MQTSSFRQLLRATLAVSTLVLGACSSMSAKECSVVDWRSIGYEDGVNGRSGDHIGQYRKACAKHGIGTDLAGYQAGREAGLREYCQPANGYRVGANGGEYGGVCPAPLEHAFRGAYEAGRELYTLEWRASNAAHQLAAKRHERNHIEQEIISNAAAIVSVESTVEGRAHALVATHQLVERAGRVESEIAQIEQDKVQFERDLQDYRARVAVNH